MKLAGIFLVLFVGTASAQGYNGPPGNDPVPAPPPGAQVGVGLERVPPKVVMRQMLLERFDRNHDGRVGTRERRHAARALRKLAKRLAREERRGGRAQRRGR
jgi:hypothetical protein